MKLKYALATLVYAIPTMLLAVPWHLIWFRKEYHDFGIYTRADPIVPLGLATMVIQGAVMAWIYPRWYRGGRPVLEGIKFSLLIGLFLFSVSTVATIAKVEVVSPWHFVVLSGVFHLIQFTVAGVGIGMVFGRLETKAGSHA